MWLRMAWAALLYSISGTVAGAASEIPRRVVGSGAGDLGAIAGRVIDGSTGAGYAGAQVIVFHENGQISRIETTDANGDYQSTPPIPPGTYFLVANGLNGDPSVLYDNLQCRVPGGGRAGLCSTSFGTPVEVTAGVVTSGIDFVTGPGGSLEGRVTAVGGQPLESVRIDVFEVSGERLEYFDTDATGAFHTDGLFAGTYYLSASNLSNPGEHHLPEIFDDLACVGQPGFDCDPTKGTALPLSWGGATTGIDFALEPLGTVSGRVIDRDTGLPLAYVRITSSRNGESQGLGGFTEADGNWMGYALPGSYNLLASSGGYMRGIYPDLLCLPEACDTTQGNLVTVPLGGRVQGVDFSLIRQGSLSGRIVSATTGEPISGLQVKLNAAGFGRVGGTATDSDGTYFFPDVDLADRYVSTHAGGHEWADEVYDNQPCRLNQNFSCDLSGATAVLVESGIETTGIDFSLVPYLFADDFEFGSLLRWSQVIGDTPPPSSPEQPSSRPGK